MVLLILNYDRVILSRKLYDVSAFLCIIPPGWTVNEKKITEFKIRSWKMFHREYDTPQITLH